MKKTISSYGISFIKSVEGCRLTAYQDCKGVWTIGVGHTGTVNGKAVCKGMTITQEQASRLLQADIQSCVNTINSKCTFSGLTQNMFDALCSFSFNVGTGALASSTLLKKLNGGDVYGAHAQFDAWHKPAQIIGRRNKEKALFISGYSDGNTEQDVHIQLNYTVGQKYPCHATGLRIRTKKASENESVIPSGKVIGYLQNGEMCKCHAAARIGEAIWIYIGLDPQKREQWVCADNGGKCYIG